MTLTHVEEKLLVDHDGAGAVLGGGLLGPPVVRNQLQPEQGADHVNCESKYEQVKIDPSRMST